MRFLLAILLLAPAAHAQTVPYDLVIRNGHIIDGTGSPWYSGDIAIRGGRIAALGQARRGFGEADALTRTAWWSRPDSSTCWGNRN